MLKLVKHTKSVDTCIFVLHLNNDMNDFSVPGSVAYYHTLLYTLDGLQTIS